MIPQNLENKLFQFKDNESHSQYRQPLEDIISAEPVLQTA
jgi:hypothetical protein